jgi:Animal haem peroxidase.
MKNNPIEFCRSVDDVDMYTGGLSEKPLEGGMLGPTMTCLIANQFVRMKSGDRYWYETSEQPQAFTAGKGVPFVLSLSLSFLFFSHFSTYISNRNVLLGK